MATLELASRLFGDAPSGFLGVPSSMESQLRSFQQGFRSPHGIQPFSACENPDVSYHVGIIRQALKFAKEGVKLYCMI